MRSHTTSNIDSDEEDAIFKETQGMCRGGERMGWDGMG